MVGTCLTTLVSHTLGEVGRCLARLVNHPTPGVAGPSDRHAAGRLSRYIHVISEVMQV